MTPMSSILIILCLALELVGAIAVPNVARYLQPRKGGGRGGGTGKGSSGTKSSGKSSSTSSKSSSSSFSVIASSSGKASSSSSGGGKKYILPSSSPFAGRQSGGGGRSDVYGNSRYGSGYPYGASDGYYYIDYRPFPYEFWPVPIAPHYYGSDQYAGYNNSTRPGGDIMTAIINGNSTNATEIYRIIGDKLSVESVLDNLVTNCSVANTMDTITAFNVSDASYPKPEQIIQWYRASTFALSLDVYNNTAALPSNMPPNNHTAPLPLSDDTPLPSGLDITFLQCLNYTIGQNVPLVDPPAKHLTKSQIGGIAGGSIGAVILGALIYFLYRRVKSHRERSTWTASAYDDTSTKEKGVPDSSEDPRALRNRIQSWSQAMSIVAYLRRPHRGYARLDAPRFKSHVLSS